jgi:predicted acyl esterase
MPDERRFITMDDGVRIAISLFLPETPGPWPVVFEARPYRKDDLTVGAVPLYRRLVAEGDLAVCRADVRGTGSSEGVAEAEYTERELQDWVEVIAWLADQPWSNGNVGMFGTSYSGFNSLQVAALQPPALKAIIPIYATDRRYTDDVHFGGGVRRGLDFLDYPMLMVAMNALPPVPEVWGETWREAWAERLEATEPWELGWLEHQNEDDFWRHGSVFFDYEKIGAATMIVAGHTDGYHNMAFRGYERLTGPKRLLFGPWSHMSPRLSMPGPRIDHVPDMIRWWRRWLADEDNGVDGEPGIVMFVRRSTRPEPDLEDWRGEWRHEPDWPPARLRPDRRLLGDAPVRPSSDDLIVRGDVGISGSIWCAEALPFGPPWDQREDEAFSLVYDWAPVGEDLEIMGHPTVELTITSSAPVAFVSTKLCDVFPDGTSALVSRGILNLTHRDGHETPVALTPGAPVNVTVELDATSWIWEPGHRVRLDIAGSDFPSSWPPPEAATLTVDARGSALILPVMDGPPVAEPPTFPPGEPRADRPERVEWQYRHDILRRETAVSIDHGGRRGRVGDIECTDAYRGEVGVRWNEPGIAWARGEASFEIAFPEATVRTESRGELRTDAGTWTLWLELDVYDGAELISQRRWDRTLPRDLQ